MIKADYMLPPASGEPPRSLVVLLHGVGSNGADLMPLAHTWAPQLPQTMFISPNAPFPFQGLSWDEAFQWFSLEGITAANREERVKPAADLLNRFLDEQLAVHNLADADLCLVGFSQGTILSLYTMLRRSEACACIMGYSGRLTGVDSLETELKSRPRVYLVHGREDEMIPFSECEDAVAGLNRYDIPVRHEAMPHAGHTITLDAMTRGGEFISFCLNNRDADIQAFKA